MISNRHGKSLRPNRFSQAFAPRSISFRLGASTASYGRMRLPSRRVLTSMNNRTFPSRATISTSPPPGALKFLESILQPFARSHAVATFSPNAPFQVLLLPEPSAEVKRQRQLSDGLKRETMMAARAVNTERFKVSLRAISLVLGKAVLGEFCVQ
jgi:hypothetical protein